ncbi:MAG: cupredoxin domain-containing protein [Pirellulales bacterium]
MRMLFTLAAATLLAGTHYGFAQVVDPDIRGPARRATGAAGEALGAPGVENRIERRQARRGDLRGDPNAWRMRCYNDEWWYYTPQTTWMYYRDNRWMPYDQNAYRPLPPRYATGYRGTYTSRVEPSYANDRFAYGKMGTPTLTVAIHDDGFAPKTIQVAPGTTIVWVNRGTHDHTVVSADGAWDSGEIAPDGTYTARFKKPGTYNYLCDLHEGMEGTIIVGNASSAAVQPPDQRDADVNVDRRGVDVDEIDRDATPADQPPPQPAPQPSTPQP